jgi:hypothetical protein
MGNSPDIEIISGSTFELRPHNRHPTRKEWICLRKNRNVTNRYLALAKEFFDCRMVEVGVDQGGSTAFFSKLLQPRKLIAIEISSEPVKTITDFLLENDPDERVKIHWGVNQADRVAVPNILDRAFGQHPLDLVVDDACHLLVPSTATFEMLFPRLRPGGLFVLEDWSARHLQERALLSALVNDVDGKFTDQFLTAAAATPKQESPMSVLICQLVVAAELLSKVVFAQLS